MVSTGIPAARACLEPGGVHTIGDHQRDLGGGAGSGAGADQRFEIGAAARDQHRGPHAGRVGCRITHSGRRPVPWPDRRPAPARPGDTRSRPARSGGASIASVYSAATTRTMPMPQLNTRSISSGLICPASYSHRNTGGACQLPASIRATTPSGRTRGRLSSSAAAGDVRDRLDRRRARADRAGCARRSGSAPAAPTPGVCSGANGAGSARNRPWRAHDLADQGEAVGVGAARRQAEEHVARLDRGAGQPTAALDRADREARQVVVAAAGSAPASRRSRRRSGRSRPRRQPSTMPSISACAVAGSSLLVAR